MNDAYDLDHLILADLARWWTAHPDEKAHVGDACNCIVAKPIESISGLPCGFVPGDHKAYLFVAGTLPLAMDTRNASIVARVVPLSPAFDELAHRFDSGDASGHANDPYEGGWISAAACVRLIERVKKELG